MTVSLFASAGSLVFRIVYYLRCGEWLVSLCDITTAWNQTGIRIKSLDACSFTTTDWVGVDEIISWFLWRVDASLAFLLLMVLVLVLGSLLIQATKFIIRDMKGG